jgi:hypothetical protein
MDDFLKSVNFQEPAVPASPLDAFRQSLDSHPEAETPSPMKSLYDDFELRARYKMFDLTKTKDVDELQEIMTDVFYQKKIMRIEKWAHDKEGLTVVTLAWIDKIPKPKVDATSSGLEDGEHPGEGVPDPDLSGDM